MSFSHVQLQLVTFSVSSYSSLSNPIETEGAEAERVCSKCVFSFQKRLQKTGEDASAAS